MHTESSLKPVCMFRNIHGHHYSSKCSKNPEKIHRAKLKYNKGSIRRPVPSPNRIISRQNPSSRSKHIGKCRVSKIFRKVRSISLSYEEA